LEVGSEPNAAPADGAAARIIPPRRWERRLALLALVVLAAGIAWLLRAVRRDAVTPPPGLQIARLTSIGDADSPALSADGRWVAYVRSEAGRQSIWLREVATEAETAHLPTDERSYLGLVFSPDSNWLYYLVVDRTSDASALYRVPVQGAAPRLVYDDVDSPVSFSPDGKQLVFARYLPPLSSEVYVGDADGATPPRRIVAPAPDFLVLPQWAPDGRTIVAAALDTRDVSRWRLARFPPRGGEPSVDETPVWGRISGLAWIPDGSGLWVSGRQHLQDPATRLFRFRPRGGSVQPITTDLNSYSGVSASADGKLLVSLRSSTATSFWRMPSTGDPEQNAVAASQIAFGSARIDSPSPSPDGTAIVYSSDASGATDLWRMKLDGTDAHPLTRGPASEMLPCWSPDGRRIAYSVLEGDSMRVWMMNADGSGARQLVFGVQCGAPDWSPDSRSIAYHQTRDAQSTVWRLQVDGGTPVRVSLGAASFPKWSPRGDALLCFTSGPAGKDKPAVALLPADGGAPRELPVPFDSDALSRLWSPSGTHLTGISADGSDLVEYPLQGGEPRLLTQFGPGLRIYSFAWLRDGSGLVVERGVTQRDVVLLQNF
jgi:Tol biopolymer transport system component